MVKLIWVVLRCVQDLLVTVLLPDCLISYGLCDRERSYICFLTGCCQIGFNHLSCSTLVSIRNECMYFNDALVMLCINKIIWLWCMHFLCGLYVIIFNMKMRSICPLYEACLSRQGDISLLNIACQISECSHSSEQYL